MEEKKNFIVENDHLFVLALAIFTLIFFQSTRQFLASIYYENLTSMGVSYTVSYILVFLAPLLMLFLRMVNVNIVMAASGGFIVLHKLYGSLFAEAKMHMIFHALVIVGFGLYLPAFLTSYYSLNTKSQKYSIPMAVITAPVLAILMDITLKTLGDGLDLTFFGVVNSKGITTVHPLVFSFAIGALALFFLYQNYHIIQEELISVRTTQRSGEKVSTFIPGISLGFLIAILFNFLGDPGIAARWTKANMTIILSFTALFLFILVILLQFEKTRKHIFNPIVQISMNAIQLFVVIDIIFLDTGSAQFLMGIALSSLCIDMFIFYHSAGSINYSIQYFISLLTIAITTFLFIFSFSVLSLVWAHVGAIGKIFKHKQVYILTLITCFYTVSAVYYNNRVLSSMVKKKWRKSE